MARVRGKEDACVPETVGPDEGVLHDPLRSTAPEEARLRIAESLPRLDRLLQSHPLA